MHEHRPVPILEVKEAPTETLRFLTKYHKVFLDYGGGAMGRVCSSQTTRIPDRLLCFPEGHSASKCSGATKVGKSVDPH